MSSFRFQNWVFQEEKEEKEENFIEAQKKNNKNWRIMFGEEDSLSFCFFV